ncbi:restriction endonuclease subunit S [Citrobacter werkmanii]|uniref:restriction endonuclease subunit S n=1 Tax=Citrobacter werkmanii TaxID=67827 RepID=UPI00123AE2C8|nr:restriction endonuclease subunit S [Citrobacter werkmanii]QET64978.1 restriction endonuclease subunit S [Citrobacter werkmanii]
MGNKWTFKSLNELGVQLIDCMHKTPSAQVSGVPYIGIPQMKNGEIDFEASPRLISESDYKLWTEKANPQYGDIILSRRCNPGETAFVSGQTQFALGQNLVILRTNGLSITAEYLRWALNSSYWWDEVEKYKNPGAIFDSLKCGDIPNFQIPAPPLRIQNKISSVLDSLTDRIKLNNKVNKILEQMSQTLFKSWFVDFDPVIDNALDAGNPIPEAMQFRAELRQKVRNSADFKPLPADIRALFPVEFEETELGWVPKGWKISTAGDELVVKGGSTPSTSNADFWENGTIHWTSPKDLTGNDSKVLLDTSKKITELGLKKISSGLLPTDTVLMSSRAPIGYLALAKTPMAINQGYIAIPSSKNLSSEYIIYWLENIMDDIKGMAGGTTFAEISKSTFKTINLVIPSKNIVDEFTRLAHQHFEKVVSNTRQITALTTLRDTLLPKLISGELSLEDLPDVANQTEPA